jgi:hypothetical protein
VPKGEFHHVGFVTAYQALIAFARQLKGTMRKAGNFGFVIGGEVIGLPQAVYLTLSPVTRKHRPATHFAQDQNIGAICPTGAKRGFVLQNRPGTCRAQSQISLQMMPQVHQPILTFDTTGHANAVPFGAANSANQHRISAPGLFQHGVRAKRCVNVPRGPMQQTVADRQINLGQLGEPHSDPQTLFENFGANSVPSQCQNVLFHRSFLDRHHTECCAVVLLRKDGNGE